ncbi:formimidoylglutamate deiminase [Burkholderiales bacterium]|nr:formimidoylglutamate deiminase [Burkholderiales bacterium]
MSIRLFASRALLPTGWSRDVTVDVADDGTIATVTPDSRRDAAEDAGGPLVPAMPNLHSHAFQRGVAGRTGLAGADGEDSFWTWRRAMYMFLERLDPEGSEAIAAQAYVEMAKAGYGTVAEFHYVHHDATGRPYADRAEMSKRILAAARTAGMPLTLLPVYYAHGGFNAVPPLAAQRRFVMTTDEFAALLAALAPLARADGAALGVAPHSLRAVTPDELDRVITAAPPGAPVHMHVAEQTQEVEECVAWCGKRPVEWLLARESVDARWCLVHATHMLERETRALAASGAVAGLAPTTEADLGDGTFPGVVYAASGGRWGVGSDSNAIVDPFVELRQLEYSQRLFWRRRNLMQHAPHESLGTAMWQSAARAGAQACGRRTGAIEAGAHADLVVLDEDDPALAGHTDTLLDAAIFGPCRRPVRHTMLAGRWVVRDGRHRDEDAVLSAYRHAMARMGGGPA